MNFWELAHALERHAEFSSTMTMQTFVGNHDVNRIAIVEENSAWRSSAWASSQKFTS